MKSLEDILNAYGTQTRLAKFTVGRLVKITKDLQLQTDYVIPAGTVMHIANSPIPLRENERLLRGYRDVQGRELNLTIDATDTKFVPTDAQVSDLPAQIGDLLYDRQDHNVSHQILSWHHNATEGMYFEARSPFNAQSRMAMRPHNLRATPIPVDDQQDDEPYIVIIITD